jgi:hypothetical protein
MNNEIYWVHLCHIGALLHHTSPNITLWTLHGYLYLYVITIWLKYTIHTWYALLLSIIPRPQLMHTHHQRFRMQYMFIHPCKRNSIGYFIIYMLKRGLDIYIYPKIGICSLCINQGLTVVPPLFFIILKKKK